MSGIGWMIAVSSQPDGLVQAPAPSFGCRVAHHTTPLVPAAIHMVPLIPRLLRAPKCREAANGRSHPLVPVQKAAGGDSGPELRSFGRRLSPYESLWVGSPEGLADSAGSASTSI
jgi:hypothetical protein